MKFFKQNLLISLLLSHKISHFHQKLPSHHNIVCTISSSTSFPSLGPYHRFSLNIFTEYSLLAKNPFEMAYSCAAAPQLQITNLGFHCILVSLKQNKTGCALVIRWGQACSLAGSFRFSSSTASYSTETSILLLTPIVVRRSWQWQKLRSLLNWL